MDREILRFSRSPSTRFIDTAVWRYALMNHKDYRKTIELNHRETKCIRGIDILELKQGVSLHVLYIGAGRINVFHLNTCDISFVFLFFFFHLRHVEWHIYYFTSSRRGWNEMGIKGEKTCNCFILCSYFYNSIHTYNRLPLNILLPPILYFRNQDLKLVF